MLTKFAVLFTFLFLFNNSHAETSENEKVVVNGLATLSCGKVLEYSEDEVGETHLSNWLNGYVTSYNYYSIEHQVSAPDRATNIFFIKNYCSKNVLSSLVAGGAVLIQDLGGPKVKFPYVK